MIEVKTLNGGLNTDDNPYRLPPNDYVDALNITHDAVEGSNDNVITPIVANRIGDADFVLPDGINKCIGAYSNILRNTIIQMIWNSNDYHLILEFNLTTRTQTKIFENLTDSAGIDVLGFTQSGKILSINVYNRDEGDLLYFLDSLGRPTGMDIALFKAGTYTPVTRDIIDKAKKPPLSPPDVVFDNDTSTRSNNFRKRLTRYKYRWIYDDFEKSTFSPISIVALQVSILSDTYTNIVTNNNVIRMAANTGDKNVKFIELAMSYVAGTNDWSDFQSIAILDKSSLGLRHETTLTPGAGLYDQVYTVFSGVVIEGDVVNIYLIELPNTKTLVSTYTVLSGDTIPDVIAGLISSFVTIGIVFSYVANGNTLLFLYYTPTYSFDEIEVIQATSGNDNINFSYSFYNDSTYPDIDIEESIELFDYVPRSANAQALLNGNVLAYIGITEGYNKDTISNSIITINVIPVDTVPPTSFSAVNTIGSDNSTVQENSIVFSGIPITGTVIEVKVKRLSDHAIINATAYTTIVGDTNTSVGSHLADNLSVPNIGVVYNTTGGILFSVSKGVYEPVNGLYYTEIIITSPSSLASTNSIPTWKWSTSRNIARGYFDKNGVTNGILYTDKVTFPAYAENGSNQPLIPFINYKINDIPPIWAYSMQFYMTRRKQNIYFGRG